VAAVTVTLARLTRSSAPSLKRSDGGAGGGQVGGREEGPGTDARRRRPPARTPGHDNIPMATRRAPNTKQSIVNVGDGLAGAAAVGRSVGGFVPATDAGTDVQLRLLRLLLLLLLQLSTRSASVSSVRFSLPPRLASLARSRSS